MKNFLQEINDRILLYDGAKGAVLQSMGLQGEECAELWNLTQPNKVSKLHQSYCSAGSDIIQTNTFCGNRMLLMRHALENKLYDINFAGAKLALDAAGNNVMVAASIGPTGNMMQPAGTMTFEEVVDIFKEQIRPLKDAGIRIVNFETFMDLAELRAAIIAAKEMKIEHVIASMTFEGEYTMSGNSPMTSAITCAAAGADIVGANCSGGPKSLLAPISQMQQTSVAPLCVKPNAGIPKTVDGKIVYDLTPTQFAQDVQEFLKGNLRLIGGCCGSTPEHIEAMKKAVCEAAVEPLHRNDGWLSSASMCISYTASLKMARMELANKNLLEAMKAGDYYSLMDYIPQEATESDAVVVDFGAVEEEELDIWQLCSMLTMFVRSPLIVCGKDTRVLEKFLRYYCGKAGVLSSLSSGLSYGAMLVEVKDA